jgi:hypothetical protein
MDCEEESRERKKANEKRKLPERNSFQFQKKEKKKTTLS